MICLELDVEITWCFGDTHSPFLLDKPDSKDHAHVSKEKYNLEIGYIVRGGQRGWLAVRQPHIYISGRSSKLTETWVHVNKL